MPINRILMMAAVKNLVFQNFWFEICSISIEIQGFDRIIQGISFDILGISKICDNRIPQCDISNSKRTLAR